MTEFVHNKGDAGGGFSMSGLASVHFAENKTVFSENTAQAGGGMHVAFVAAGPQFTGVEFESNVAVFGGGAYVTACGTDHDSKDFEEGSRDEMRTVFDRCEFVNNTAFSDGGGISSVFGQDYFVNSTFVGNTARFGGALSLAGASSSVHDCVLIENSSEEDGGAAVYNRGLVSSISNTSFVDNTFNCASGEFRETILPENKVSVGTSFLDHDYFLLESGRCSVRNFNHASLKIRVRESGRLVTSHRGMGEKGTVAVATLFDIYCIGEMGVRKHDLFMPFSHFFAHPGAISPMGPNSRMITVSLEYSGKF